MSSISRPLSGEVLLFRLHEEHSNMRGSMSRGSGPTSRTLLKDDALSVTLITLVANGQIKEHRAPGPITVQVLSGSLTFAVGEASHEMNEGDLLFLKAGLAHSVATTEGATFLLTLVPPQP